MKLSWPTPTDRDRRPCWSRRCRRWPCTSRVTRTSLSARTASPSRGEAARPVADPHRRGAGEAVARSRRRSGASSRVRDLARCVHAPETNLQPASGGRQPRQLGNSATGIDVFGVARRSEPKGDSHVPHPSPEEVAAAATGWSRTSRSIGFGPISPSQAEVVRHCWFARKPAAAGGSDGCSANLGRPGADRPADLPLVPGGVHDPAEPPAMLIPDRSQRRRTEGMPARRGRPVVDDQQYRSVAPRFALGLGRPADGRDPEARVADGDWATTSSPSPTRWSTVHRKRPRRTRWRLARGRPRVLARCSSC